MANIVKTYSFVNGQPADATQVNQNFDDIIDGVGDISAAGHALIDDADVAAQRVTLGLKKITTGSVQTVANVDTVVTHGLGSQASWVGLTLNQAATGQPMPAVTDRTPTTFTIFADSTVRVWNWIAVA